MDAKLPGVPRTCVAWNHGAVAAMLWHIGPRLLKREGQVS
jgi:hypothetical protein